MKNEYKKIIRPAAQILKPHFDGIPKNLKPYRRDVVQQNGITKRSLMHLIERISPLTNDEEIGELFKKDLERLYGVEWEIMLKNRKK